MLPELINEDQTGFMSGRYTGDNLRLIYDMIAYLKENNLPGLLLNRDLRKLLTQWIGNLCLKF